MKRKDLNYMRHLTLGFDSFVHDEWGYGGDDRHLNLDRNISKENQYAELKKTDSLNAFI